MHFFKCSIVPVIHIFLITLFVSDCDAQKKFEIGLRFDPLNLPVNLGTYEEVGPGYHDIRGKGYNTSAGFLDLSYWPHRNLGFSIGFGIRRFSSEIAYDIPDALDAEYGLVFSSLYKYNTRASGPGVNMLFRLERFRAKLGMGVYNFHNPDFFQQSSVSSATWFDPDVGVLAKLELTENSYWTFAPTHLNLLQFAAEYNIIHNFYLKVGFETTLRGGDIYPYTLTITGFTEHTTMEEQLLNDFRASYTHAAFSAGIGYVIGFGGYDK